MFPWPPTWTLNAFVTQAWWQSQVPLREANRLDVLGVRLTICCENWPGSVPMRDAPVTFDCCIGLLFKQRCLMQINLVWRFLCWMMKWWNSFWKTPTWVWRIHCGEFSSPRYQQWVNASIYSILFRIMLLATRNFFEVLIEESSSNPWETAGQMRSSTVFFMLEPCSIGCNDVMDIEREIPPAYDVMSFS